MARMPHKRSPALFVITYAGPEGKTRLAASLKEQLFSGPIPVSLIFLRNTTYYIP